VPAAQVWMLPTRTDREVLGFGCASHVFSSWLRDFVARAPDSVPKMVGEGVPEVGVVAVAPETLEVFPGVPCVTVKVFGIVVHDWPQGLRRRMRMAAMSASTTGIEQMVQRMRVLMTVFMICFLTGVGRLQSPLQFEARRFVLTPTNESPPA
jgi:hypothetical protein